VTDLKLTCVGTCQVKKVLDHALHLEVDLQAITQCFLIRLGISISRKGEFELRAETGQRSPQLVGYVARETPLALKRGVQSSQQVIEMIDDG
jgi:hypothetical protein